MPNPSDKPMIEVREFQSARDLVEKLCEEQRHGAWRPGWQENGELKDKLAAESKLVDYWRGIAIEKGVAVERAHSVQAVMNTKVRELERDLSNQREWIEDMVRLGKFIQGLQDSALHAGERYVDIAMRLISELMIARGDRDAYRHMTDDQVHAQIRLAGVVIDGTGERGTAPAEASPREIARRSALGQLSGISLGRADGYAAQDAVANAIAFAIDNYHQAQQEDSGG